MHLMIAFFNIPFAILFEYKQQNVQKYFRWVVFFNATHKEIQIILSLFPVCHLLLQTKSVPSQPASNVGGLVIH